MCAMNHELCETLFSTFHTTRIGSAVCMVELQFVVSGIRITSLVTLITGHSSVGRAADCNGTVYVQSNL